MDVIGDRGPDGRGAHLRSPANLDEPTIVLLLELHGLEHLPHGERLCVIRMRRKAARGGTHVG